MSWPDEPGGRLGAWLRGGIAGIVSIAAHAAVVGWLLNAPAEPPDSVQGAPIDLDLAIAPPDAAQSAAAPAPAASPSPDATPLADAGAGSNAGNAAVPEPTPTPSVEPTQEVLPTPTQATTPEPTQQTAPPAPTPTPDTPPPSAVLAPTPLPAPKPTAPKPDPRKLAAQRERAEARKPQREASATRAASQTASNDNKTGAAQHRASSGSDLATWRGEVLAHLSEYKPSSPGGATGVALVAFTIDGSGRVLWASLARSCGDAALDRASVQMVRNASPVPAPPADLGARVSLTVPVRFR